VDPAAARKTVKQRFRTERATAKYPSRTGLYDPASAFQRLPEVTDIELALGGDVNFIRSWRASVSFFSQSAERFPRDISPGLWIFPTMSGIHSNSVTIRPMHVIIGQPINNDQGYFSFKEGGLVGYTPGHELDRNSRSCQ
jgi:hypothetical protein